VWKDVFVLIWVVTARAMLSGRKRHARITMLDATEDASDVTLGLPITNAAAAAVRLTITNESITNLPILAITLIIQT